MKLLNKKTLFFICYFFILSAFASGACEATPFKGTPSKRKQEPNSLQNRLIQHSPASHGAVGDTPARVEQRQAQFTTESYKKFTTVGQTLLSKYTKNVRKIQKVLQEQTSQERLTKKSIISAGFAILKKEDGTLLGEYPLLHLYWSSQYSYRGTRKNPDGKEISPDQRIKGLATPVCKKGQSPMQHHHSERAFFTHIYKDFKNLLAEALFPIQDFDSKKHIFAILMGNSYSSCVHCARFLGGSGESSTKLADLISVNLQELVASPSDPVDVLIFHQGLKSYSNHSKKSAGKENHSDSVEESKPVMEIRPSSSMLKDSVAKNLLASGSF